MIYLNAFIFCGIICTIGQIILDNTNFTPGHITVIFAVIGTFLDVFNIYDKFILWAGGGALVPITSFGHTLTHGAIQGYNEGGILGLFNGTLNLTSAGISAAIIFSFFFSLIFKSRD
ncbi:MAG: stage V sporulation protein AE [Bacilli bacterium]|nr:stage V sporulation protein AE [Bacilli bacterium]